ncbi:MAG: enoyl-CoA hydratase/isomerase family protein [Rhizobiaceae bacterium]
MVTTKITFRRVDEFALITLDGESKLNALSLSSFDELDALLDQIDQSDCRGILVTGAGTKSFCAGVDVSELREGRPSVRGAQIRHRQHVMSRLARHRLLSVALINGLALGGGLELALACTFRIATRAASMGMPEVGIGFVPGGGGTQRLPALVGRGNALDLLLTGRRLGADDALKMGLVDSVVDDLHAGGLAFARRWSRHSLPALRLCREAIDAAGSDDGYEVEARSTECAWATDDALEGLAALAARRDPQFRER